MDGVSGWQREKTLPLNLIKQFLKCFNIKIICDKLMSTSNDYANKTLFLWMSRILLRACICRACMRERQIFHRSKGTHQQWRWRRRQQQHEQQRVWMQKKEAKSGPDGRELGWKGWWKFKKATKRMRNEERWNYCRQTYELTNDSLTLFNEIFLENDFKTNERKKCQVERRRE